MSWKKKAENSASSSYWLMAECICLVGFLAVGLAVRVFCLDYAGENAAYYDAAKVVEGSGLPGNTHGITFAYVYLLRILFTFVGNRWIAGIWLQICLQLLACLLWYLAVRRNCGAVGGFILTGIMMFSPAEIISGLTYSPDILYLCIYGVGLLWVASFSDRQFRMRPVRDVLFLVLGAALLGLICYLDITGITLVVLALGFIGQLRKRKSSVQEGVRVHRRGNCVPWTAMAVVLGFLIGFRITVMDENSCRMFIYFIFMTASMICVEIFYVLVSKKKKIPVKQMTEEKTQEMEQTKEEISGELDEAALVYEQAAQKINQAIAEIHKQKLVPGKVQFIENPLPLPKKHVKKAMDYTVSFDESMMHYDIEVDVNDDFDI